MKKTFTKKYILENKGCYSTEQVENLSFINQKTITIQTILNNLPIKDFNWFLMKKCELTIEQKKEIALLYAECVLPIYEEKYPNDNRVKDCIQGIKYYRSGKIKKEELIVLRRAAAAAYAAAADADAYADAAYAAYAAAYAADAAAYAADAAYAAAAAAYAAAYADAAAAAYAAAYADAAYAAAAAAYADAYAAAYAAADADADADAAYAAYAAAYADAAYAADWNKKLKQAIKNWIKNN